jgi:hypothetical protein
MSQEMDKKTTTSKKEKPCRACYDFKSWTKLQQDEHGKKPLVFKI